MYEGFYVGLSKCKGTTWDGVKKGLNRAWGIVEEKK
jgi:hypothetical protein